MVLSMVSKCLGAEKIYRIDIGENIEDSWGERSIS
jgi:hypothetical protein